MKQLLLFIFFSYSLVAAKSQSITPNPNREFCPNTEYTFTVVITKPYSSMIGEGCVVTQLPFTPVGTTFTFKGKFNDVNAKQTFRVIHPDNSTTPFEFKRIKSFFYRVLACAGIQPNQTTIIAPRCQIANFPISFANIQYNTEFESPALCFGSVPDYEYLLPSGWSINGNTSNGSTWITGVNSATITSDLATGNGGVVKIRPSNIACGPGLVNGQAHEKQILISRPRPALSIVGDNILCSGTKTYSIGGALPPGATVCWTSSNPFYASVPTSNCGTSIPLTYVADGSVTLTATITDCIETYSITSANILIGATVTGYYFVNSNYNQPTQNPLYVTNSPIWLPANQSFGVTAYITSPGLISNTWTIAPGSYPFSWGNSYNNLVFSGTSGTTAYSQRNGIFTVSAQTACGAYTGTYTWPVIVQGWFYKLLASPNPAKGNIHIQIEKVPDTSNRQICVLDKGSKNSETSIAASNTTKMLLYDVNSKILIRQWNYSEKDASVYNLNIAGIKRGWYVLKMERDGKITTTKILIQ